MLRAVDVWRASRRDAVAYVDTRVEVEVLQRVDTFQQRYDAPHPLRGSIERRSDV